MKSFTLLLWLLFCSSSFSQSTVSSGQVINASNINSLQTQVTTLKNSLKEASLYKEQVLWTGNLYIDGVTNYNLWSSSAHQSWDSMDLYFGYDNGSNPVIHRIELGPSYAYGSTANASQVLLHPYGGVYRRLIITTTGIDAFNGEGSSVVYLRRVVGRVKTTLPEFE